MIDPRDQPIEGPKFDLQQTWFYVITDGNRIFNMATYEWHTDPTEIQLKQCLSLSKFIAQEASNAAGHPVQTIGVTIYNSAQSVGE